MVVGVCVYILCVVSEGFHDNFPVNKWLVSRLLFIVIFWLLTELALIRWSSEFESSVRDDVILHQLRLKQKAPIMAATVCVCVWLVMGVAAGG